MPWCSLQPGSSANVSFGLNVVVPSGKITTWSALTVRESLRWSRKTCAFAGKVFEQYAIQRHGQEYIKFLHYLNALLEIGVPVVKFSKLAKPCGETSKECLGVTLPVLAGSGFNHACIVMDGRTIYVSIKLGVNLLAPYVTLDS